jgi:hypothetical protein
MVKIVNLSSAHTYKIEESQKAFVELCDNYSQWAWCSACCPTFFTHYSNKAWVAGKYTVHLNSTINPYKLGKMTTEEFLEKMCDIFSFLVKEEQDYSEDIAELSQQTQGQVVPIEVDETDNKQIAKALLEQAWTTGIDFTEEDKAKLQHLLKRAEEEPIYFISNTNHLDVNKILRFFQENFPDGGWLEKIDIAPLNEEEEKPIQIADNIYLCLSYRYGAFKTPKENTTYKTGTPSLLQIVVTGLQSGGTTNIADIKIISQYEKDLQAAREIGIPEQNIYTAENYYQEHLVFTQSHSLG